MSDLIEHDRIKKDIDDYGTKKIKEGAAKATKTNESPASVVLKYLYEKNSKDCIRAGNASSAQFFNSQTLIGIDPPEKPEPGSIAHYVICMPALGANVGRKKTDKAVDHKLAWKEARPIDWEYYKRRFEHTAFIYLNRAAEILYDKENGRSDDPVKQVTLDSWFKGPIIPPRDEKEKKHKKTSKKRKLPSFDVITDMLYGSSRTKMETPLNRNMFQESAQSSVDRISVLKDIEDIETQKCMKCVGDQESIDQCCNISCHYFGEKDILRNKLKTLRCAIIQRIRNKQTIDEIMIDPETAHEKYLDGEEKGEYCFHESVKDPTVVIVTGIGNVSLTTSQIVTLPSFIAKQK